MCSNEEPVMQWKVEQVEQKNECKNDLFRFSFEKTLTTHTLFPGNIENNKIIITTGRFDDSWVSSES
jgi:hypothetical protein